MFTVTVQCCKFDCIVLMLLQRSFFKDINKGVKQMYQYGRGPNKQTGKNLTISHELSRNYDKRTSDFHINLFDFVIITK